MLSDREAKKKRESAKKYQNYDASYIKFWFAIVYETEYHQTNLYGIEISYFTWSCHSRLGADCPWLRDGTKTL